MRPIRSVMMPALLCLILIWAAQAQAQEKPRGNTDPFGLRAGYTSWDNLEQFHVGAHLDTGEMFPNVAFIPGFEIGFGDDALVTTLNGDLVYRFTELSSWPWGLYGGGSLSFNIRDEDPGDAETDLGLSGLIGMTRELDSGNAVLMEVRLGVLDSPDFKLTFGYTLF